MTATHPISSDNLLGKSVSTEHGEGQTTGQWVRAHKGDCDAAGLVTEAVTRLETTWTCGDPPAARTHGTDRNPGENNDDFELRHFTDTLADMANGHDPIH